MHAEIAGAGIAGLTAAAALAQRGWTVRVHERNPEMRYIGAGIYIWENGLRVLEALGAYEPTVDGAHPAYMFEIRDHNNKLLEQFPFAAASAAGFRTFTPVRRQLLQALQAAAERAGAEIVLNSEAVSATPDGVLVTKDGKRYPADLVIAADGVNSPIRDSLGLLASRKQLVDGAIRLTIPRLPEEMLSETGRKYVENWSGTRRILVTPCSDDTIYLAFTALDTDAAAKRVPVDKALWKRDFPHLASLIDRVGDDGRWDIFEVVHLHSWSKGRVAIVGDAAHAQAPNLGQGGGCAMMNGLALAVAIEEAGGDVEKGLRVWEERERPLTEHTQRVSSMWSALTTWPPFMRSAAFWITGRWKWLSDQRMKTAMHAPTGWRPVVR